MATTSCTLSAERRVVMNKFKECNQCPHEFNDKNLEPCKDCVPKKKTNADRIRSMSDEELYNLIEKVKMCGGLLRAEESSSECKGCKDGFCCNVLYWLQSEAE